jgi:hypothetical protein
MSQAAKKERYGNETDWMSSLTLLENVENHETIIAGSGSSVSFGFSHSHGLIIPDASHETATCDLWLHMPN